MRFKRHYVTLSEKETNELVAAVADMIVTFIKSRREHERRGEASAVQPRREK